MKPYIFIHINKCGGTSVKRALGQPRNKYQRYKHERIADIKTRMPEDEFEDAFKFTFIRNPYDRIASMYFYRKNNLKRVKLQGMDFEQWFYKAFTTNFTAVPLMNKPCWDYITVDEKIAVDFIGRFENMQEDWHLIGGKLVAGELPKLNATKGKRDVHYSEDMKRIVRDQFKKDFELYECSLSA